MVRYTTTVVWSVKSGMLNETFWGYQNFPSVFWAVAVFVMIKYMPWEKIFSKTERKDDKQNSIIKFWDLFNAYDYLQDFGIIDRN